MALNKEKVHKEEKKIENATFTKTQIISSKKYSDRKDLLNGILKDGKSYSFSEVDSLIEKFMKGKVK